MAANASDTQKRSKVIGVVNRKGGVGKTTISLALAQAYVSEHRRSVFLLDLDPQASASEALLERDRYEEVVLRDMDLAGLLEKLNSPKVQPTETVIKPYIAHMRHNLLGRGDINLATIPNSLDLWKLEHTAFRAKKDENLGKALLSLIEWLRSQFDIVIMDCPPGWTLTSETGLKAADFILCPVTPDRLAMWGMMRMKTVFSDLEKEGTPLLWRFVISMMQNTNNANDCMRAMEVAFKDQMIHDASTAGHGETIALPRSQAFVRTIGITHSEGSIVQTFARMFGQANAQQVVLLANRILALIEENPRNG
jgi:chromosome partitioning protein